MKKGSRRFVILGTLILIITAILVFMLIYWRLSFTKLNEQESATTEYEYHYVLITESKDSLFWKNVYQGALDYGKEHNAYIELMGENLVVKYSSVELCEIAIESKVDGILLEGIGTEEQKEIIDRAYAAQIPVITLVNDSIDSDRVSFVGLGDYNMGREYARAVIRTNNSEIKNIKILGDGKNSGDSLTNGFLETIQNEGNHIKADTEFVLFDNEDTFSYQDKLKSILMAEDAPDVIVCTNEEITLSTYQTIVDSNLVGKIKVIGYYSSEQILSAIEKGGVDGTIILDAYAMGTTAVEAITSYREYGRVSDYIPVEAKLITKKNVKEYLVDETD